MKRRYYVAYWARFADGKTGCGYMLLTYKGKIKIKNEQDIEFLENCIKKHNRDSSKILQTTVLSIIKLKGGRR